MARIIPPDEQSIMGETPEIRALEYELRRYPPMLDYIIRITNDLPYYEEHGLTTPADLLGDRAIHAIMMLLGDHDDPVWRDPEMRVSAARSILECVPVLWPESMWTAARALPMPAHVIAPDVMPYPMMWWRFAQAHGAGAEIEAMMLIDYQDGIHVIMYGASGERGQVKYSGQFRLDYHKQFPEDYPDDSNVEIALQMLAFMNSRYVDSETRLDRGERRRITHAGLTELGLDAEHPTHIIRLRSSEPVDGSSTIGGTRDWAHRWFVRGHYRAQWHPSIRAHRVRWIAAYVKGPTDKLIALPAVSIRQ